MRNTDFDAANYFDKGQRAAYHQNQFGGTFGGPIKKDKIFFFADYQGNRLIQGVTQRITGAPTADLESGNLASVESMFVDGHGNPTVVNGTAFANQLTSQFASSTGQLVQAGERYFFPGCASTNPVTGCVFANGQLPTAAFNPISSNLLPFIQPSNGVDAVSGLPTFTTNSGAVDLNDNKFSVRGDINSRFGLLTGYYYFDKFNRIDPYWPGNAPVYPGFEVDGKGQTHTIDLGDTKTLGSASVNEFRLGYFRLDTAFNQPRVARASPWPASVLLPATIERPAFFRSFPHLKVFRKSTLTTS